MESPTIRGIGLYLIDKTTNNVCLLFMFIVNIQTAQNIMTYRHSPRNSSSLVLLKFSMIILILTMWLAMIRCWRNYTLCNCAFITQIFTCTRLHYCCILCVSRCVYMRLAAPTLSNQTRVTNGRPPLLQYMPVVYAIRPRYLQITLWHEKKAGRIVNMKYSTIRTKQLAN